VEGAVSAQNNFRQCETCGEFGWFDGGYGRHTCKPIFTVRIQCYGQRFGRWEQFCLPCKDDPKLKIHAVDERQAAEKAVAKHDWDRTDITNSVRCMVLAPDGKQHYLIVRGEMVPEYTAGIEKVEPARFLVGVTR
jgi:hypothetical protein